VSGNARLAARIGAKVNLLDVRLTRASAVVLGAHTEGHLHADIENTYNWVLEVVTLVCEVGCEVRIRMEADTDALFECNAAFAAFYQLPDGFEADEDEYEAFASTSATFSLHPYLREMVQSLTMRAGLPPFALPTLRAHRSFE
jgi:preprotein translocase subunit SecB